VTFSIVDDGPGFDWRPNQGTGLRNLADRVAALGGALDVRSGLGSGTTIEGFVPLT